MGCFYRRGEHGVLLQFLSGTKNTIKRDYVPEADLSDAQTVLRQLPG